MIPAFTLRFIPAAGAGLAAQELHPSEIVVKKQGPESSHADPAAKRRRYFKPEDSDSDSESEEVFDLESYYDSATEDRTAEDVQTFISVAFKRCLSHQKRKELAREFPKPQAVKAPETDPLLADFLGKRYPEQQDKQLARVQTSILAACAPLTDLWSRLCDQGLSGEEDELIPVEEVLKVIRASLALIGNSSNYISQLRRKTIIEALPADKANLAKIMKQVCKRQIENSSSELFGDQAIKAVKRRRYFKPEDSDSDSESEEVFDLESYYDSATEDRTAEDVQTFISVAFKRCLSHQKRKELAREFPKPQAVKAPETDPLLADFLGKRYPEQQDKQLARVQTSILAACAPLTDLWSRLCDQGLSGEEDELIPVEEVLKVIRASLALIGNSSNYISQLRRKTIIEALPADKANLAKIMKQVCKRQIENSSSELFGDQAIKAVSERVNTLETFSKTASKSEVKLRQQSKHFFRGGPPTKYVGGPGATGAPYIPLRDSSVRVSGRSQP